MKITFTVSDQKERLSGKSETSEPEESTRISIDFEPLEMTVSEVAEKIKTFLQKHIATVSREKENTSSNEEDK